MQSDQAQLAAYYDGRAAAYSQWWSDVLLPASRELLSRVSLTSANTILDLGSGVGTLLPAIKQAAQDALVVAVDRSPGMLNLIETRVPRAVVDAHTLPFRSRTFDAVILAFMIQHLADPRVALAEVRRVMAPGGRIGIAMWGTQREAPALAMWNEELDRVGAPPAPPIITQAVPVDSTEAIKTLLADAGFREIDVRDLKWTDQPDLATFTSRYLMLGAASRRFAQLDADTQADFVSRIRGRLDGLPAEEFRDRTEVVGAVGTA
jgi:ubiquinone/menaquinone biosynthesis C-methylase UbiE